MGLSFVDRHTIDLHAPQLTVWRHLESYCTEQLRFRPRGLVALSLGLEPPTGFAVEELHSPTRLVLEGRHRFAVYELVFTLNPIGADRSALSAATYAEFPGWRGRLYRALVIGSGGHRIAVRVMLQAVATRVKRAHRGQT